MKTPRTYVPAAGWHWALPIYDLYVELLGFDAVRSRLLEDMDLALRQRVLDVGCGTGTLAMLIKRLHPDVTVVGLDPDPKALVRAIRKASSAGVKVHFTRGFSDRLPYRDTSFDRVCCTGMFSLLPTMEKKTTLGEVFRVLKPGGSFHLLDLVKDPPASSLWGRLYGWTPLPRPGACTEEETVGLMRQAGLTGAAKTAQHPFWLWPVARYCATR